MDVEKVKTGIFEMLQRDTWKDIDKERHRFQPVLNDTLTLLKKQEPKPVIFYRQCEVEPGRWERKGFCPKCHQVVLWIVNREYCGFCGQKVKWNESD